MNFGFLIEKAKLLQLSRFNEISKNIDELSSKSHIIINSSPDKKVLTK